MSIAVVTVTASDGEAAATQGFTVTVSDPSGKAATVAIFGLRDVTDRNILPDPTDLSRDVTVLLDVQPNDETVAAITLTLSGQMGDQEISCRGASTDADPAAGLAASSQAEIECFFDTDAVMGECMGMHLPPMYANGEYELGAYITTTDGDRRNVVATQTITLNNPNYVMLAHSPGNVSTIVDGVTFYGGPVGEDGSNVNSFHACPVAYDGMTVGGLELSTMVTAPGAVALDSERPALALSPEPGMFTWTVNPAKNGNVENRAGMDEHWIINDGDITDEGGLLVTDNFRSGGEAKLGPLYFDFKAPTFFTGADGGITIGGNDARDAFYSSGSFGVKGLADGGVGGEMATFAVGDASVGDNDDDKRSTAFEPVDGLADVRGIANLPEDDKTEDFNDAAGVDRYVAEVTKVYDAFMNVASLPSSPIRTASTFGVDKGKPELTDPKPSRDDLVLKGGQMLTLDVKDPKLATGEDGSGLAADAIWSAVSKAKTKGTSLTASGTVSVSADRGADGDYSVTVEVLDNASPMNKSSHTFEYTLDTDAPTFTIDKSQADIGLTNAEAVTVEVGGMIMDDNVIRRAELSLRGGACANASVSEDLPTNRVPRNKRDLENGKNSFPFDEDFTIIRPNTVRAPGPEMFCFWLEVEDVAVEANNSGDGNTGNHALHEFEVNWGAVTLETGILVPEKPAVAREGSVADNDDSTQTDSVAVSLLTEPSGDVTVAVSSSGAPVTIDPLTDTLTFTAADYDTDQYIRLGVTHDLNADSETVTLQLTAKGGGYDGDTAEIEVETVDDDIGLSVDVASIDEDAAETRVIVTATGNPSKVARVITFDVQDGTTDGSADYSSRSDGDGDNEITIKANEPSGMDTIFVTPVDDDHSEEVGEAISIVASNVTVDGKKATLAEKGVHVTPTEIMIKDQDPDVLLSLDPASLDEDDGETTVNVTATLRSGTADAILSVTVNASTAGSCTNASWAGQEGLRIDTGQKSGSATLVVTTSTNFDDDDEECMVTGSSKTSKPGVTPTATYTVGGATLTIVNTDGSESN